VSDQLTATVAGGGIAGLACAAALAQAGWQVTVLERAPAFGEVGAGLAVTANGIAALDAIGAADAVRAAGYQDSHAGYQDYQGRWIMRMPEGRPAIAAVNSFCGIHRQRLHAAVLATAQAAGAVLVTDAEVTAVRPGAAGGELAEVTWRPSGGTSEHTARTHLVIGADGVRSAIRGQLYPRARLRYSGSTSWRAVVPDSAADGNLIATWGPGTEFGSLRISDSEIYWYGYFRNPEGASFDDELAAARRHFARWTPRVRDLVGSTTAGQLIRNDVYHLPDGIPAYVSGRVVLAGDAAHAMLPTIGQGAASALEDGICVGRLIGAAVAAGGDLSAALAAYDDARRPRCQALTRQAALAGRFGSDLAGGWRQTVRNTVMGLLPAGPLVRAGAHFTGWTPPDPPERR
jgi:2-polyprenyl-6-methoxyphenol hydroxylase-like FAD-dependent oxidoreductase